MENTDDTLYLDFHYCPLVKAWQKAGCSDEVCALRYIKGDKHADK